MISVDGVIAVTVILIVLITFLIYYHIQNAYRVRSDIYKTVKNSISGLWEHRILPANKDYFTTRLDDTIKAMDSYNDIISPVINQSLNTIAQNEQSCAWTSDFWVVSLESAIIILVIALLLSKV